VERLSYLTGEILHGLKFTVFKC